MPSSNRSACGVDMIGTALALTMPEVTLTVYVASMSTNSLIFVSASTVPAMSWCFAVFGRTLLRLCVEQLLLSAVIMMMTRPLEAPEREIIGSNLVYMCYLAQSRTANYAMHMQCEDGESLNILPQQYYGKT
ncbi:hypothetical protein V1527DRAFT_474365 [Lipomyces starkeyi]